MEAAKDIWRKAINLVYWRWSQTKTQMWVESPHTKTGNTLNAQSLLSGDDVLIFSSEDKMRTVKLEMPEKDISTTYSKEALNWRLSVYKQTTLAGQ